ncbi:MAG TPA: NAD(P)-dependent oxidoreductase [Actinopolymorphaceae bacterium]
MRVLLVDVPQPLRTALAAELGRRHEVVEFAGDVLDAEHCAARAEADVVVQGRPDIADGSARIEHATRGTWNLLTTTRAERYVQLSSLRHFAAYDPRWAVDESWAPRPTTDPADLAVHLAELTSREVCRARPIRACVLRLDEGGGLSVDDAVRVVASEVEAADWPSGPEGGPARWRVRHVRAGAVRPPSDGPVRWPHEPAPLSDLPTPHRITVFGAAGPLAAATVPHLAGDHVLRLTDALPLAELAKRPPQSPGAPRLDPVRPPHEEQVSDLTDADAVLSAAAHSDCLVNCAVIRHEPVGAFGVNVIGAYHTMRAAVAHGIRRVVHTGPTLVLLGHPVGYAEDHDVSEDAPPRAGDNLYFLTKLLAQEICRIFAEEHQIACPMLLYCAFVDPATPPRWAMHPFAVSWNDAGRAMAAAATVRALPTPTPVLHVLAPSPHGRFRSSAVREVLGWEPLDRLEQLWCRTTE